MKFYVFIIKKTTNDQLTLHFVAIYHKKSHKKCLHKLYPFSPYVNLWHHYSLPLFPFSLVFYVNNNIFSSFINNNRIIKNKLIISLFRFFPIKLLPNNSKKFSIPTAIKLRSFHQSRANSSKVSNNLLITFDYNNFLLLLNKFIAIILKHHQ